MKLIKTYLILGCAILVMLSFTFGGDTTSVVGSSKTYADNSLCAECHEEVVGSFHENTHGRIRQFEVPGREIGCVGCHTNGVKHAEEGGDPELLKSFGELDSASASNRCLSCHLTSEMSQWHGSAHANNDTGCLDCHSIHKNDGYKEQSTSSLCYTCHSDVQAEMMLPSHHPVAEGKMDCNSCHNPHGSTVDGMIRSDGRLNDMCFKCHAALQGPFVFEHAPVAEDCTICHTVHGSVANNLLTENEPFLCLQCHEMHFHTGAKGNSTTTVVQRGVEIPNPYTSFGWKKAFATNCTQCHPTHHGSDLPSQGVTSSGKSFTR